MIYSINESVIDDDRDIFIEFGFDKADDYEQCHDIAKKIFREICSYIGNLPSNWSGFGKIIPVNTKSSFDRQVEKVTKRIEKSKEKINMSMGIHYISISHTKPQTLANEIGDIIFSHGFKRMPKSDSKLKDFFKAFHLYKQVSDNVIAICDMGVTYNTTQYGMAISYATLNLNIAAVSTSDKNLKKLNLLKEGSELVFIDEGQQTEEYKARKAKEAEDAKKADEERIKRRFTAGISKYDDGTHPTKSVNLLKSDKEVHPDDADRYLSSRKTMNSEIKRRNNELVAAFQDDNKSVQKAADNLFRLDTNTYNMMATRDAVNRHMRRHPNQYKESCGVFFNISFI